MNAEYDEDLSENRFLQALRDEYGAMFQRVVQEGWIICVPRSDSFASRRLQENEVNAHILIPGQDLSVVRFNSLSGKQILLEDRVLHIKHDNVEQYSSRLLFEEVFYSNDLRKYRVW